MADTHEDPRSAIADRLQMARKAAGLTQGQVGKLMQMHRPTISEIEAGRRRVSADELIAFAEIYGVSVEWITSAKPGEQDALDDRILLAARQLNKLSSSDLDRLMELVRMLRQSGQSGEK